MGRLSTTYRNYMASQEWAARRSIALCSADYACQLCGEEQTEDAPLDVHHKTYARFMREEPGDLMVLCRECHNKAEQRKRERSNPKPVNRTELINDRFAEMVRRAGGWR